MLTRSIPTPATATGRSTKAAGADANTNTDASTDASTEASSEANTGANTEPTALQCTRRGLLLASLGSTAATAALPRIPFNLGLPPYVPPSALMSKSRHLREHLRATLGTEVEMWSARNYLLHLRAIHDVDYDVAMAPAHFARLAQLDWKWQMLAATFGSTPLLALVRRDSPLQNINELADRPVAIGTPDPLSMVTEIARRWLLASRLERATLVMLPTASSAVRALLLDEVSVVMLTQGLINSMATPDPTAMRRLAVLADVPTPLYLARPDMDAELVARWRVALASFHADVRQRESEHPLNMVLRMPSAMYLETLDPYADGLRRQLQQTGIR